MNIMQYIKSKPIPRREQLFPELINKYDLKIGAEIGVSQATHAIHLLSHTKIFLYLVDHYADNNPWSKEKDGNKRYEYAQNIVKNFSGRFQFIRNESNIASKEIKDETLDFCYIDADHSYDGIKTDMESWLPKVKKGGIMCGHDYNNKKSCRVKKYIDRFVKDNNYEMIILTGVGSGWLFVK